MLSLWSCEDHRHPIHPYKNTVTLHLLLSHGSIKGIMELSTAHSWTSPEETISVNTPDGEYLLRQMEQLSYKPHPRTILKIPTEKISLFTPETHILAERNNFSPLISGNQLHSHGFISEIKPSPTSSTTALPTPPLTSMTDTYTLINQIHRYLSQP